MVGILVPSYALLLPLPIVSLSSLTMHRGHFIPATPLLANSALLSGRVCILLSSLCLAYLCFLGCQPSQHKGVIQAWNTSTVTLQEQLFQRPANNDPSLVCYLLQKQAVLSYVCIFPLWFLEQFHGTADSISWHSEMKQMQHLNIDFPSQKCHPVEDEIPQA